MPDRDDTLAFSRWIEQQINNMDNPGAFVLSLPGAWEILSEELVNEWIDHCDEE
jgi:hypothetical protein